MSKSSTKHPKLKIAFSAAGKDFKKNVRKVGKGLVFPVGGIAFGTLLRTAIVGAFSPAALIGVGIGAGLCVTACAGHSAYAAVKAVKNSNKPKS